MGTTQCPGQDTAFWQPGDIFETPCANCGYMLEFFKDDATRRCRQCGQLVRNPKLNLGCAQWCEHAKECLGYDPAEAQAQAEAAEGGESTLVDRLIEGLKGQKGGDQAQTSRALAVLEQAKALMAKEGGSPRVILSAALLGALAEPAAEEIMSAAGLDAATRQEVSEIIERHRQGQAGDSLEAQVVWDAQKLVELGQTPAPQENDPAALDSLKTQTGRQMAQELEAGRPAG